MCLSHVPQQATRKLCEVSAMSSELKCMCFHRSRGNSLLMNLRKNLGELPFHTIADIVSLQLRQKHYYLIRKAEN